MPDYGHAYDVKTFHGASRLPPRLAFLRMRLAEPGCVNGIGGGKIRVIAVPVGQYVWAIECCIDALAGSERDAHPNWYEPEPEPQPYRPEVNIFHEAVYGRGRRKA